MKVNQFDVVVVGCGVAGLSAAVAAQQQGARVCVLERSVIEERGGNTRHTGAWLRIKSEDEVTDDFEEHFAENAGGYLDPTLTSEVVHSPEHWPKALKALSFVDPNVISTFAQEAFSGIRVLKSFVREKQSSQDFAIASANYRRKSLDLVKVDSLFTPLISLLVGFSTLLHSHGIFIC